MRPTTLTPFAALLAAIALAGCSNNTGGLMTSSIGQPAKVAAAKPKIDPACMTLTAQINSVRQEGTPARVMAIASGKTKVVRVKRASLERVAELDRLNQAYQARCSKYPGIQAAAVAPKVAASTVPVKATARSAAQQKSAQLSQSTMAPSTPIVAVPKR